VSVVVAARRGDPAAFAKVVEHWDQHLRAFVHHTLGGDGPTDRVLAATYLRAYRALPRYSGELKPGLWLHRIAYLAALDDLRRGTRDPLRRRPGSRNDDAATPGPTPPGQDPAAILARLAPDQRALAVMVDLERYRLTSVAVAFDTPRQVAAARLGAARRALVGLVADDPGTPEALVARPPVAPTEPAVLGHEPPETEGSPDPIAEPAWVPTAGPPAAEESVRLLAEPGVTGADPPPSADASDELAPRVGLLLADLPVPPPGPDFWTELGRRLLAERDQPAAPPPDPVARLARHPAEAGFHPDHAVSDTVSVMADQAERARPRRSWRRPVGVLLAVVVLGAVVAVAVRVGTSDPPPDGSVPAEELAETVAAALGADDVLTTTAELEVPGADPTPYAVTLDGSGSWSLSRNDQIELTAYDTTTGIVRSISARADDAGGPPTVEATIDAGLASGEPDPAPRTPTVITDLQQAVVFLRSDPDRRAPSTSAGDTGTWTFSRNVGATDTTPAARWEVEVRRTDGLPQRIEVRQDGELVRRTRYTRWAPGADPPAGTFDPPIPEGITPSLTTAGFATTDLAGVAALGRGGAITPGWLPEGFELTTVAIRASAPDPGTATTGDGTNPPDESVASLGFQRGPERITITTRASGGRSDAWRDPFAADGDPAPASEETRTLGDGRFNGLDVVVSTDALGRARLWGVSVETVLTVSGDLTDDEAVRVASSLRG
jgi:RNA polymerase sigma-70 factor (ECF subfamily)